MDHMKAQLLLEMKKSQEKRSSILCRQDYPRSASFSESSEEAKKSALTSPSGDQSKGVQAKEAPVSEASVPSKLNGARVKKPKEETNVALDKSKHVSSNSVKSDAPISAKDQQPLKPEAGKSSGTVTAVKPIVQTQVLANPVLDQILSKPRPAPKASYDKAKIAASNKYLARAQTDPQIAKSNNSFLGGDVMAMFDQQLATSMVDRSDGPFLSPQKNSRGTNKKTSPASSMRAPPAVTPALTSKKSEKSSKKETSLKEVSLFGTDEPVQTPKKHKALKGAANKGSTVKNSESSSLVGNSEACKTDSVAKITTEKKPRKGQEDRKVLITTPKPGSGSTPKSGLVSSQESGSVSVSKSGSVSTPKSGLINTPESGSVSTLKPVSVTTPKSGLVSTPESGSVSVSKSGSVRTPKSGLVSTSESGSVSTPRPGSVSTSESGIVSTPEFGSVSVSKPGSMSTPKSGLVNTPESGSVNVSKSGSVSTPKSGLMSTPESGSVNTLISYSASRSELISLNSSTGNGVKPKARTYERKRKKSAADEKKSSKLEPEVSIKQEIEFIGVAEDEPSSNPAPGQPRLFPTPEVPLSIPQRKVKKTFRAKQNASETTDLSIKSFPSLKDTTSPKTTPKRKSGHIFLDSEIEVTCAECKRAMRAGDYLEHNYEEHNMLAWIVGEERPSVKELLKEFKFKSYICKRCCTVYSAAAYANHVTKCDWDSEKCCYLSKKKKVIKGLPPFLSSEELVTCKSCSEVVLGSAFLRHNYERHNMLSWVEGDHEKVGLLQQLKVLGFVSFKCRDCLLEFSPQIFANHVSNCPGKPTISDQANHKLFSDESETVTCTDCGVSMVASQFLGHNYQKHNMLAWVIDKPERPSIREMLGHYRFTKYSCKACRQVFVFDEFAEHAELCKAFEPDVPDTPQKSESEPIFSDISVEVRCDVCKLDMPAGEFLQHDLVEHNLLAWIENWEGLQPSIEEMLCELGLKSYTCMVCAKKFPPRPFARHVLKCGAKTSTPRGERAVRCDKCLESMTVKGFWVHSYYKHDLKARVLGKPNLGLTMTVWKNLAKVGVPLQCPECSETFINPSDAAGHSHSGNRSGNPENNSEPEKNDIDNPCDDEDPSFEVESPKKKVKKNRISEGEMETIPEGLKFSDIKDLEMMVTCTSCRKEVQACEFLDHNYKEHNFRAWILHYRRLSVMEQIKAHGLEDYKCNICGETLSPELFDNHSMECAVNSKKKHAIKVYGCNKCDETMLETDFYIHNYRRHNLLARIRGREEEKISYKCWNFLIKTGVPMKCPRCAATFGTVAGCVLHDGLCGAELKSCSLCNRKVKDLKGHLRTMHKKVCEVDPASLIIERGTKRKCAQKAYQNLIALETDETGRFCCNHCELTFATEAEVEKHSAEHMEANVQSDAEILSDAEMSSSEEEEEAQEPEKKRVRVGVSAKAKGETQGSYNLSASRELAMMQWMTSGGKPVQTMSLAHQRMKKYVSENWTDDLKFTHLKPSLSDWSCPGALDVDTIESLPVYVSSLKDSKLIEPCASDGDVLFCGDTVVSIAWCPDTDYIAIATESLIQLWDSSDNSFKYSVSHSNEKISQIVWCPSGGVGTLSDDLPRIGIIAVTNGNGVSLLSLPDPRSVATNQAYHVPASLSLTLAGSGDAECVSVAWFQGAGHRKISAGFSNGIVAVWDLGTNSPLLHRVKKILPQTSFLAHSSYVYSVSFCSEFDARYLASCSIDGTTCVWDLREVGFNQTPLMSNRFNCNTKVEWSVHWPWVVLSGDYALNDRRSTYVVDCGFSGKQSTLAGQGSSVFAASLNSWFDIVAHGTESGEVICAGMTNPAKDEKHIRMTTVRVTEFGLDEDHARFIVNDRPSKFGFRAEDCRTCPTGGEGVQQVSSLAWGLSENSCTLLAVASVGGVVQILDAREVIEKMKETKRNSGGKK